MYIIQFYCSQFRWTLEYVYQLGGFKLPRTCRRHDEDCMWLGRIHPCSQATVHECRNPQEVSPSLGSSSRASSRSTLLATFFFFFYPHQRTHIHKISHRQCCIKQATRELSTGRISAHLLNEVEEVEVVGYAKLRKVKHRQKHDEYRLLGWELHLSLNFLVLKVEFLLYVAKL